MGHRNRNDRTRHVRRSSGGVLIAALALVFFVSASHLSAQQVTSQSRVRVESDELAPAPTVLQRVDGAFAPVVKAMGDVLMFRLFGREQTYIQFDEYEQYVRPRGATEPFKRVESDGRLSEDEVLSEKEVERRDVLGELARGRSGAIRDGKLNGGSVEFVTVQGRQTKYVLRDGVFHEELPLREKLSNSKTLNKEQVAELGRQGLLKLNETSIAGEPAHVLKAKVGGAPIVVLWLSLGAIFFTVYMGFFNVWGFRHAIDVVRGKYDNPDEPGEVTHFQALASALSATVGLGNIAGVTIAMTAGGPGAFFWMLACGFLGMSSKFVECTLGQKYRHVNPDGTVLGGPMQYLDVGLRELGLGPLGKVLAIVFAIMCILASFGGGNMFQANQSSQQMLAMIQLDDYATLEQLNDDIKAAAAADDIASLERLQNEKTSLQEDMAKLGPIFLPMFGLFLAAMVAVVIIGGIKRIGAAASKIVPTMCMVYIIACLWIILTHFADVPSLVMQIFSEAFRPEAFGGGMLGVLVIGVQRAAFSNEAGVGSAAIAHSAARTKEPIREGAVALMGPFIDTIVVCSMTALVILITGAWNNETWIVEQGRQGTPLTSKAFAQEIWFFPYILSMAVVLFAYSTMISWSYYGERCWERLFGPRSTVLYKVIYVTAVFIGAIVNLGAVLDFSDMMILSMAFPNVFGVVLLSPQVRRDLRDYWRRYKAGEFKTFD
ncbi:MAG TPA: alanine/glycine:cation symporter family protein [Pirellulaceae bacterium]|nr:alanine/glycine:cation symporter family protein [Pirellulaceae bacterium]